MLEWRAHGLMLAGRHLAAKDQAFGTATDAGIERAHPHFTRTGKRQEFIENFAVVGHCYPEGTRHEGLIGLHVFERQEDGWVQALHFETHGGDRIFAKG